MLGYVRCVATSLLLKLINFVTKYKKIEMKTCNSMVDEDFCEKLQNEKNLHSEKKI